MTHIFSQRFLFGYCEPYDFVVKSAPPQINEDFAVDLKEARITPFFFFLRDTKLNYTHN